MRQLVLNAGIRLSRDSESLVKSRVLGGENLVVLLEIGAV